MTLLLLMTGISFGLYLIFADVLKIPYLKTSKAIMNINRQDKKLTNTIDAIVDTISVKLSKFIMMDSYKKSRISATLSAAGLMTTPEQ